MNYPNGKKTTVKKDSSLTKSRLGMSLEDDINASNKDYLLCDLAVIHKKPTPITIVDVDYPKRSKARIKEAYFKLPSTTDYNGIYKGKYIDFEAKECSSKTSFPFSSIHAHQINHLSSVIKHGAIAFIIIRMSAYDEDYLIDAKTFIDYYNLKERLSLSYDWIKTYGHRIGFTFQRPCNYLKVVDEVYKI